MQKIERNMLLQLMVSGGSEKSSSSATANATSNVTITIKPADSSPITRVG
jgi:hypothetical protein